jgi:hypothetical protein
MYGNYLALKKLNVYITPRVTRLGEFSPIGRLFSLSSFLETFWATFSTLNVKY